MDTYKEYMVKKKTTGKDKAVRPICIAILVLILAGAVIFAGTTVGFIIFCLDLILGYYFIKVVFPKSDVEYEYLYCDKHISVDAIYSKATRKNLGDYDISKMDLLCPVKSYRADEFKNKNLEEHQYWSLEESELHEPYALFYDGKQKIVLDLPRDFVKMVQNNSPRKVFFD